MVTPDYRRHDDYNGGQHEYVCMSRYTAIERERDELRSQLDEHITNSANATTECIRLQGERDELLQRIAKLGAVKDAADNVKAAVEEEPYPGTEGHFDAAFDGLCSALAALGSTAPGEDQEPSWPTPRVKAAVRACNRAMRLSGTVCKFCGEAEEHPDTCPMSAVADAALILTDDEWHYHDKDQANAEAAREEGLCHARDYAGGGE